MPGMRLYRLADLSRVWVEGEVFEQDLQFVHTGSQAHIEMAAYPGQHVMGTVTFVYPTVDEHSRTNRVRVTVANPGLRLKPGMFATMYFDAHLGTDALTVPREAVIVTGERNLVFVKGPGGMLLPRGVVLGARSESRVQILHGLVAGDSVVTAANFLGYVDAGLYPHLVHHDHHVLGGGEPDDVWVGVVVLARPRHRAAFLRLISAVHGCLRKTWLILFAVTCFLYCDYSRLNPSYHDGRAGAAATHATEAAMKRTITLLALGMVLLAACATNSGGSSAPPSRSADSGYVEHWIPYEGQRIYAREWPGAEPAIVLMHGYRYSEHEARIAAIAQEIGYPQISASHRVSPLMKLVARGDTTVVDAYLSPILRRYVEQVASGRSAECIALEKSASGVQLKVDCQEGSPVVDGTHLLLAVGRGRDLVALARQHGGEDAADVELVVDDEDVRHGA